MTPPPAVRFGDASFDAYELALRFSAQVKDRETVCLVPLSTLEECFGCAWEDAEEAFVLYQPRIESVARRLLVRAFPDSPEELRLRAADFAVPEG